MIKLSDFRPGWLPHPCLTVLAIIALAGAWFLNLGPRSQTTEVLGEDPATTLVAAALEPATALPELSVETSSSSDYEYSLVGSQENFVTATRAGLVLMGGGKDIDECFQWMIERSGGGDFLVLRASGTDAYNDYIQPMTSESGLRPNSVATLIIPSRAAAADPFVVQTIERAEALWIAGGDQANYVCYWQGTPVIQAIEAAVARGVPLGGTSSGLDVLGQYIFSSQNDRDATQHLASAEVLADPFHDRITLVRDFLNVPHLSDVLLDSHFVQHDRLGRMIAFLARILHNNWTSEARGIGIQRCTALLVEPDGSGKVVCRPDAIAPSAYFLRLSKESVICQAGQPLRVNAISVDRLAPGDTFNLQTWHTPQAVSFALDVRDGALILPQENLELYPAAR